MAGNENTALVRATIEAFRAADAADRLATLLTDDYCEHAPRSSEAKSAVALAADIATMFTAFPDMAPTIELQLAQGDLVATRLTWRGTHTGDYGGVAPTSKPVAISVNRIDRIADGRVAESWVEYDPMAVLVQIGVAPAVPDLG